VEEAIISDVLTMRHIYLDYNASTPIDPAVAAAMMPFLQDHYGNPSSGHWAATTVKTALETARGQVAAMLGCHNDEVVFTSGGSEANNLALKGVFFALRDKGDHIVTCMYRKPYPASLGETLKRLGSVICHYANLICRRPIEKSPLAPLEMSLSPVFERHGEVTADDGDCDEPRGDQSDGRPTRSGGEPDQGC
jgi:hypothetical protein